MMIANYHTHTPRCNHADGSEAEYVASAKQSGLQVLGFSDHTPYFFDGGYYSHFRMRPEQFEGYVETLQGLRVQNPDLELHIGLEAEYYPKLFSRLLTFLCQYPLEYLILGQHAIFNEQDGPYTGTPTEDKRLLDQYVGQTAEAMQTGLFSCFAHPDIFRFVGDPQEYDKQMRRLCRTAKDCGVPLEINLLGIREGRDYPAPRFWRLAGEEGVTAILGCDAHAPEHLNNPAAEAAGRELAARYGVRLLDTLRLKPIR